MNVTGSKNHFCASKIENQTSGEIEFMSTFGIMTHLIRRPHEGQSGKTTLDETSFYLQTQCHSQAGNFSQQSIWFTDSKPVCFGNASFDDGWITNRAAVCDSYLSVLLISAVIGLITILK